MDISQLIDSTQYQPIQIAEESWHREAKRLAKLPGVLLDLGGGAPYQGVIEKTDLGKDTTYLCLDIRRSTFPNIVGDAHTIPLTDSSVQSVYCNAVLEHVAEPQLVVDEINRVLVNMGYGLIAVPFSYPYHDQVDYYRYTDTALYHMFRKFKVVKVIPLGDYVMSSIMHLIGFRFPLARKIDHYLMGGRYSIDLVLNTYEQISGKNQDLIRRTLKRSPIGWYVYCRK